MSAAILVYLLTLFWLYLYSLRDGRSSRLMRAAYCLVQHLDDVLDGDRTVDVAPPDYVDSLLRSMELFGDKISDNISTEGAAYVTDFAPAPPACAKILPLARYVKREVIQYEIRPGEFRENFLGLLDVLHVDWQRRQSRQLLPACKLSEQHRRTFEYSANLTLVLLRSRLRAVDVPELIAALSWCSPIRDLQEDLDKGLINIPRAVMEEAQTNGSSQFDYETLRASTAVRAWLHHEFDPGPAPAWAG